MARVGLTVVVVDLAVPARGAAGTLALVARHLVLTLPTVEARVGRTLVDGHLTQRALVALLTFTSVKNT